MKLWAISDLHVGHPGNRAHWAELGHYPRDWLILAGDVGETEEHLRFVLEIALARFARVLWVPGNHELWSLPREQPRRFGVEKYEALVEVCREMGVLTPEDPWVTWPGPGIPCKLALLSTLYDYSFRPLGIRESEALTWAAESGVMCADEELLSPHPFDSIKAWCEARCDAAEVRLQDEGAGQPLVLVNHFPLRYQLARLPRIPRFSIWCGTRRTEDWHRRFKAHVVVCGHLHIPTTDWVHGVRFEEVSLGYPRQWLAARGVDAYLREILPGPAPGPEHAGPFYRGYRR